MVKTRVPAASRPVARVLPLLGLAHLDRLFDYQVSEEDSAAAQPGTRVRVRFAGRLVDALVYERVEHTEHTSDLRFIERVISPLPVFPESLRQLVDKLAQRYGATRSDIIRSAVPPRHAGAEKGDFATPWEELGAIEEPDLSGWSAYIDGEEFVDAILSGGSARAAWQVAPGDDWASALAALAVKTAMNGGGVLVVLPDARAVERVEGAVRRLVKAKQVTVLGAGVGPQARYRRFVAALQGQARIVIGTRSAAYAPVRNLRLAVIFNDGDENLVDPRAPYTHAREVLTTRCVIEKCGLLLAGHTRSTEAQLLVEAGWLGQIVASRDTLRARMPRIQGLADSDFELARDPLAAQARIPGIAFEALREALEAGRPALVQTPRKGYIPTLSCGNCRAPARCRYCNGPLEIPQPDPAMVGGGTAQAAAPTCRWCGRIDPHHRCSNCGSTKLRAVVLGADRTVEELGRAFPQVPVVGSGGNRIVQSIKAKPQLVVATPGATPEVEGGSYGAAVFLDTWAMLGRQDLRAEEDTLAKWVEVATQVASNRHGGRVVVAADAGLPIVQSLIRWDVVGAAHRELTQRRDVHFPPAVHMAAVDGPAAALHNLLEIVVLPAHAEVLGPVDLPPGESLPGEYDEAKYGPVQRMLIRTPLGPRAELGIALKNALASRLARKDNLPLRVQVDPVRVG